MNAYNRQQAPQMKLVAEMHKAFGVVYNEETANLYITLLREELDEFLEVFKGGPELPNATENLLKEACDVLIVMFGLDLITTGMGENVKIKMPADLAQDCFRFSMVLEIMFSGPVTERALEAAFVEVMRSNMSKLDNDGKPIRREDGKVLKGPNYSEADMKPYASMITGLAA